MSLLARYCSVSLHPAHPHTPDPLPPSLPPPPPPHTTPPFSLLTSHTVNNRKKHVFAFDTLNFTNRFLALCVCRNSRVQPPGVDPTSPLPGQAGHRLVAGHPALRPHLRRHSLRAGPPDPPRRGDLQAAGVPGGQRPCPEVPGPPALGPAEPGGDRRPPLDAGGPRHPHLRQQRTPGGHRQRQPRLRVTVEPRKYMTAWRRLLGDAVATEGAALRPAVLQACPLPRKPLCGEARPLSP